MMKSLHNEKTCLMSPRCAKCVVKALRDVKVTDSKLAGIKNLAMLRVGVAQVGCDPRVILMA